MIEGLDRVKIDEVDDGPDVMSGVVEVMPDDYEENPELEALVRAVLSQFEEYVK